MSVSVIALHVYWSAFGVRMKATDEIDMIGELFADSCRDLIATV